MMNQEEIYFGELSKHRARLADALDDPALRGVKNSVVEKYSDQAHFIYELLQNADDADATSARFVLYEDKLIFAHNGTRRFTVSDPMAEERDSHNHELGDINAITSIANSNKREASIGKFGVGFKAVFRYTQTPHIYDPNIFFKIERFIVPAKLERDFPGRNADETMFVFPFDHPERSREEAFEDISEKLHSLDYPVLFLENLKNLSFDIAGTTGSYSKNVIETRCFGNTIAENICLVQESGDNLKRDTMWLFSRHDENGRSYSTGFFLNDSGNLIPMLHSAFCFFPTKEVTNLNFIIHASFLLTDSREGIRAGIPYNNKMIQQLADLAADCLVYLRDIGLENGRQLINDDIFDIIPYHEGVFSEVKDKRKISFKPFYSAILNKMRTEALLPASEGYVSKNHGCWASVPQLTEIFSDEQLASLNKNENLKWVFRSFGRQDTQRKNKTLTDYIESIIYVWLDEGDMINGWRFENSSKRNGMITSAFIEEQPIEWLHTFYRWSDETSSRTDKIKTRPVFLNSDRQAVSAIDLNGHVVLFLPTDVAGYNMVLPELLENRETLDFLKKLGVKKPSLYDEIYNQILPLYKDNDSGISTNQHFTKFFEYYMERPQKEADELIKLIRNYAFIRFKSESDKKIYRGKGDTLYFPTDFLRKWFHAKPDTRFVEIDNYVKLVGEEKKEDLIEFLAALGVESEPRVLSRELTWGEAWKLRSDWPRSTRERKWTEKYLDGSQEVVDYICQNGDSGLSELLWERLIKCTEYVYSKNLKSIMNGRYEYFYYEALVKEFDSREAERFRRQPWLMNQNKEFVTAGELTVQTLWPGYDITEEGAENLLDYLGIEDEVLDIDGEDSLTDEQRAKIQLAEILSDIPEEELKRFAEQYRAVRRASLPEGTGDSSGDGTSNGNEDAAISRLVHEIGRRAASGHRKGKTSNSGGIAEEESDNFSGEDSGDEDDYIKPSVDFSKKIEKAKQRSADELAEIIHLDELTQKALSADKYSFGWFQALLELEAFNSSKNSVGSREISISFSKVEREEGTSRTLVLKNANRYIPQSMEDLADIPLELHFADQPMVKVAVEVINVKSYTLRTKLKTNAEIGRADLSLVTEARIVARNPVFLLEELRRAFGRLPFEADYDMQHNLCGNIEFVFGPPGTGKTTHLVKKVILPLTQEEKALKVLVLTPTNKAADVLTRRMMEVMDEDYSYLDWLVRFGATNDSVIEQCGVFRDKTFDIREFPRNVTVTTIARFPYDYFLPEENTRLHLSELKWDYIVIDEASMIPLANIIFLIYKKTPEKFIIAGDPFQIEPITTVDIWKNENIYTMVGLHSFENPMTIPHSYPVKLLTTQYRSIPVIGEVFSRFAYGGVLRHNRTESEWKALGLDKFLDIRPLSIIKYPVSRYESIYRPKRLQSKSNYQVYSALFAFEFVKYLASLLEKQERDEIFRIGLIAPYRAQADLVDKLLASFVIPGKIDIQVGTIHGFQGDECDMIIALFNPPPTISASEDMFLNKLNIINVSISRARDYLVIVMPDDDTENVDNLKMIKRVERLCCEQSDCRIYQSNDIEEMIFGSRSYLEDNSFSTSHQLVNVYGKPEKYYEIRSEDDAVDVQII